MMAGPEDAMAQEARFLQAFQGSLTVTRQGDGRRLLVSPDHMIHLTENATQA
jgi:heat shock protein HslJ